MKPAVLAFVAMLVAGTATAQVQLVPAQSEISFTTRQMGVPVDGRFTRFSAQITLDPKQPERGSIAFVIDTAGTRFGAAEVEAEVVKPTWLNVAKFPQARFQSSAIRALGGGRFEVAGRLSVKGREQPITVPVTLRQAGSSGTAIGSFSVKRLAFQIGDGDWSDTDLVADEVQVRFSFALQGLPSP